MSEAKKVGIMGGTFNPIHLGHLIIAENAREYFGLDEILFIPVGKSHMKKDVLDSKTRISMTGIAIEDNPDFALSTIEVDRDGISYSYETIAELKANNPETIYYFIVGADSLFTMEEWMCPEKVFGECIVVVSARKGLDMEVLNNQIDTLKEKYHADIRFIPTRTVDISSTNIRERVREGKSIRYMVPDSVLNFIQKNKLYLDQ